MLAEFKEKTYEKYFGYELARRTKVTFSPDQCDEAFLGFDDAFFMPWDFLMHHLPHRRRRRWSRLHGLSMSELNFIGDEIGKHLPTFRFNLFVQYKRPEYLSRPSAAEWLSWRSPYFRYETTPHQHSLLAKIEQQSQGRAGTVYAAPAFWRSYDLWSHVTGESVIAQSKGKAHSPYEFGVKVSVATTLHASKGGQFVTHVKAMAGAPYDGHTLAVVIPQMERQIGATIKGIVADRGYRGHNAPETHKFRGFISGQRRRVTEQIKRELRRRSAVEPVIGHLKFDHRMGRNNLADTAGDAANVVLAAAGYNFRRLLKWLALLCALLFDALSRAERPENHSIVT